MPATPICGTRPSRRRVNLFAGLVLAFAGLFLSPALRAAPPPLAIAQPAPGTLELSWDDVAPGYVLEYSGNLIAPILWDGVVQTPALAGGRRVVTLAVASLPSQAKGFFRLIVKGSPAGLDYLLAHQNTDGSWGPGGGAGGYDTSAALAALALFGQTSTPSGAYGRGLGQLGGGNAAARNFDELSRRIVARAGAGENVAADLTTLTNGQNLAVIDSASAAYPGRGWGLAEGFGSTPLDTALALRALQAAGRNGGLSVVGETVAAGATSPAHAFTVPAGSTNLLLRVRARTASFRYRITYPGGGSSFIDFAAGTSPVDVTMPAGSGVLSLTGQNLSGVSGKYSAEVGFTGPDGFDYFRVATPLSLLGVAQNPDGGWGVMAGEDSHWLATTETLRALGLAGGSFVSPATATASAWLLAHQNGDGGFSAAAGASTAYETALAMLALRDASPGTSLANASVWMRTGQLPNGSWDNNPGVTALAVQALRLPPVMTAIPNQTVSSPTAFATINLDNFVTDPDHADNLIAWTATGQSVLTVNIVSRVATITYPAATSASEPITFTATDPDGYTASRTATFTVNYSVADYTIARGGFATGIRNFTTTPAAIAATAFYNVSLSGVPPGVTYSTTGVSLFGDGTVQINYRIDVSGAAATGLQSFQATYSLLDSGLNPLGPLTGNVFNFTILVTP